MNLLMVIESHSYLMQRLMQYFIDVTCELRWCLAILQQKSGQLHWNVEIIKFKDLFHVFTDWFRLHRFLMRKRLG